MRRAFGRPSCSPRRVGPLGLDGRWAIFLVLALLLSGRSAVAGQSSSASERKTLAEMLFRMGRDMMRQSEVATTCRKFESSPAEDPAPWTLLNLAVCQGREGRVASAWAECKESISAAVVKGDTAREALARTRADALEERVLPRMRLVERSEASVVGLRISRAGVTARGGPSMTRLMWRRTARTASLPRGRRCSVRT